MAADTTVALITSTQAKAFLKITASSEDTIIDLLVNNMSQEAARYCGRSFIQGTYTEYYDGDGCTDFLVLKNYPIISVTSLYVDSTRQWASDSAITVSTDVQIEAAAGIIRLWNNYSWFAKGKGNVRVVYVAGYANIPYDLQHAALLMVMYAYKRHYQDQRIGLQSETIGDRNMSYSNEDIPKTAKLILDKYRRVGDSDNGY